MLTDYSKSSKIYTEIFQTNTYRSFFVKSDSENSRSMLALIFLRMMFSHIILYYLIGLRSLNDWK